MGDVFTVIIIALVLVIFLLWNIYIQLTVTKLSTQVERFISHEESERGTRARENERIHAEFKNMREHQMTTHQNLAILTEKVLMIMEDSRKRHDSFNALISSLPRRQGD